MAGELNPNSDYPPDAPVYPTQPVSVILPNPAHLQPISTENLILHPFNLDSETALNSDAAKLFLFRSRPDVTTWLYALSNFNPKPNTNSNPKTKLNKDINPD